MLARTVRDSFEDGGAGGQMYTIKQKVEGKGRCLKAARDILPGELVLNERCLFWGPIQTHVCVLCLDGSCEHEYGLCADCGYPLCKKHQQDPGIHHEECSLLASSGGSSLEDVDDQYLVLRVIRCLLAMMNHRSDMKGMRGDTQVIGVEWVVEMIKQVEKWEDDDIFMAIDCVLYNCVDDVSQRRGFYPTSNLLEHSCISNTRNIISGDCLECRATVHIQEGEAITTSRVNPLLDVYTRQKKLRERFHIDCFCARCCSPTELGCLSSALCCLACENIIGFFLPPDPADNTPQYTCNICEYKIPQKLAVKATQELIPIVQEFNMFGIDEQEDFMNNLLTKFHENHSLVLQLKMNIAKELGRNEHGSLNDAEDDILEKKIMFCEELLTVMDIIEPGLSSNRGRLLYELADALKTKERRHIKDLSEERETRENTSLAIERYLYEALKCLENDKDHELKHLCMKIKQITYELTK